MPTATWGLTSAASNRATVANPPPAPSMPARTPVRQPTATSTTSLAIPRAIVGAPGAGECQERLLLGAGRPWVSRTSRAPRPGCGRRSRCRPCRCSRRRPTARAGPAMSRWTQGMSPANSDRNSPAVRAPPPRPPVMFFRSAISESRSLRYSSGRGRCHIGSPARSAAVADLADPGVVVAHQPGDLHPEGHHAGAGQGGQVDDGVGLLLDGQRQPVGQDQPALGVGVEDLDRLPVADLEDVAGLDGPPAGHVLGGGHEGDDLRLHPGASAAPTSPR